MNRLFRNTCGGVRELERAGSDFCCIKSGCKLKRRNSNCIRELFAYVLAVGDFDCNIVCAGNKIRCNINFVVALFCRKSLFDISFNKNLTNAVSVFESVAVFGRIIKFYKDFFSLRNSKNSVRKKVRKSNGISSCCASASAAAESRSKGVQMPFALGSEAVHRSSKAVQYSLAKKLRRNRIL